MAFIWPPRTMRVRASLSPLQFCSNVRDKCKDQQVTLRRCRLGEMTAQTLCRVFKYAIMVKIDLSDNPVAAPCRPCLLPRNVAPHSRPCTQIKDSAAESLVQMLKTHPAIRRLILKNCRLTSSSGILIARAVKDGLPLQVLDLGNTAIDSNANVFNGVVGAAFAGAMISSLTLQVPPQSVRENPYMFCSSSTSFHLFPLSSCVCVTCVT